MTEPIGCGGELQRQSIAEPGILPPGIELGSEFEEMRCPIVDDAVHHNRIANALEISFDNQPLVMKSCQSLRRAEIGDPARVMP